MWELDQLNVEFPPIYKHLTEYSTAKMGPKKKGAKKKVGKKTGGSKGPTIIDGVPVSEMSKDQLEGHVRRLQDEVCKRLKLLRIVLNSNYLQSSAKGKFQGCVNLPHGQELDHTTLELSFCQPAHYLAGSPRARGAQPLPA